MRTSLLCVILVSLAVSYVASSMDSKQRIPLPEAKFVGEMPVEEAIDERRSVREFSRDGLTLDDVSQLVWAAQGITSTRGFDPLTTILYS